MEKLLISERLLFRGDELDMTTKLKRVNPVKDPSSQRLLTEYDRLRHAKF